MDGLKPKYEDKLEFEIISTDTERGQTEPEKYKLGRHGMVILGPGGDVLWRKKGHMIEKKEILAGINQSVESSVN